MEHLNVGQTAVLLDDEGQHHLARNTVLLSDGRITDLALNPVAEIVERTALERRHRLGDQERLLLDDLLLGQIAEVVVVQFKIVVLVRFRRGGFRLRAFIGLGTGGFLLRFLLAHAVFQQLLLVLLEFLRGAILALKADGLHMHVHIAHVQSAHRFDGLLDVFLNALGNVGNGRTVFDDDGDVHGHRAAVDIHAHALGEVAGGFAGKHIGQTGRDAGHARHAFDFLRRQTRDGLDHAGGKGYAAVRVLVELDVRRIIVAHIADLLYLSPL